METPALELPNPAEAVGELRAEVREALDASERGEALGTELATVGERLGTEWASELKEVGASVEGIRGMVEGVTGLLGDGFEFLRAALEGTFEALSEGAEWLRAHPEVVESMAHLTVIALACIEDPGAMARYLGEHPELIQGHVTRIHAALA